MQDVQNAIYLKLANDATISGYTGAVSTGERIFDGWPRQRIPINVKQPAYICVCQVGLDVPTFGRDTLNYQVSVWGKKQSRCLDILERVSTLLDKATLTATSHTVIRMARQSTAHVHEEEDDIHHYPMLYECRVIP